MDPNAGLSGIIPDRSPDSFAIRLLLFSVAFVWFFVGLGIALGQSASEGSIIGAWHLSIPEWFRVTQWWIGAVLILHVVFLKPHPVLNAVAVAVLMMGPTTRVLSYLSAWVQYLVPGGNPGEERGWYWATMESGGMLLVVVVALFLRTGDPKP